MQRQEDAEFGRAKSTSPPRGSETSPVSHKGFVTLGVKVIEGDEGFSQGCGMCLQALNLHLSCTCPPATPQPEGLG